MYSLYEQYKLAYPEIHYDKPEDKANTYGWRGCGIGWQKDPSEWKTDPIYPSLEDPLAGDDDTDGGSEDAGGEMMMKAQKVEGVGSYGSFYESYMLGEKGSGLYSSGEVQDFYKLRDYHYENGTLFEDPQFPADRSSLSYSHKSNYGVTEWRRPSEICDNPKLFVEGFSRFDVQQGALGDCWFLAAVANITLYHNLFFQVVPIDQSFDEKYAGIFHFRFWQYGRWIDVVIDDRLPVAYGELTFLSSTEKNEFWSALLEKAYAKLHGSYEALEGGNTCEAMEDFTGGVSEIYFSEEAPPNLYKIMTKAFQRGSLICAAIEPDPSIKEAKTREGLVKGHAYSLTRVLHVDINTPRVSGKIPLVRIRNPWGNEMEWNGAWSDGSPEWSLIPDYEKEKMGLNFDNDGEFWMSFQDMMKFFQRIEICNLNPDSLEEGVVAKKWELSMFEGEWVTGVTAGGCRNYINTFGCNPQYNITLDEPDEDSDNCTFIVSLMQKNRRKQRNMGHDHLTIGFVLYFIPDPENTPKPLNKNFFRHNAMVGKSPVFVNLREVSCRFNVPPGTYCIIPSTFEADEEGEFLIRVFSENKNNLVYVAEGDDDEPPSYRPPPPPPPRSHPHPVYPDQKHGGFDFPSFPFSFFNNRFNFLFNSPNQQRNAQGSNSQPNQAAPYPPQQSSNPAYTPQQSSNPGYPPQPSYPPQQQYSTPYPQHSSFPAYPPQQQPQNPYPSYTAQTGPYPVYQQPYPQQPHQGYPQQPHPGYPPQQYGQMPQYPPQNYPPYPPY